MFSAPLWLFGLAALAIPLILHLWSRRPRHLIRVGSLRHVDPGADARSWSTRLTDPLLLLLRLALLSAIVLALAGLRLPVRQMIGSPSVMTLVEPALLDSTSGFRSPVLDSLAREREVVRLLAPGLPKVQLDGKPFSPSARYTPPGALWDALAEADALVGPQGAIDVIARPRVAVLGGQRPALRAPVRWHPATGESAATWTAARWPIADDSLLELHGRGNAQGAAYTLVRTPAASTCPDCLAHHPRRMRILTGGDSVAARRIAVALAAIGASIGASVTPEAAGEPVDAIVSTQPLDDALLEVGHPILFLSPRAVHSTGLADSLWAQWPWPLAVADAEDPRLASLGQVQPLHTRSPEPMRGDSETTRHGLLLLALLLFVLERWVATLPGRRAV